MTTSPVRIPLRCPYCGGTLTVTTRSEGRPYMQSDVPDEIECTTYACSASWKPDGTPVLAALWIEYPDTYPPPTMNPTPRPGAGM